MPLRLHLYVSGRVQGVFFRQSAKHLAVRLGLAGWARNTDSGSVEIIIEGEEDRLKQFLSWAQKGSPMAEVDAVDSQWLNASGEFEEFEIY